MSAPRRICAVTGSRADWGLLLPVLRRIRSHPDLALQLVVTGSHLESNFGHTRDAIAHDGFAVDADVPLPLDGDGSAEVCRALGHATAGIGDAFARLSPDLVLVLGDRYEILGAVQAALVHRIPVAHIAGGDISTGAIDDSMRHAITKLSHLHFATNEAARQRLLQMGESPHCVHLSGSPGIDAIREIDAMTDPALTVALDFEFRPRNIAVACHPETLSSLDPQRQCDILLDALATLDSDIGIVATAANADPGGQVINAGLRAFCAAREYACMHASLGQAAWYGLLRKVDALVGNSSAGLYEMPSFGKPTVNIGWRQHGRPRATSVFDCAFDARAIGETLHRALDTDCTAATNPYGDGRAAERIVAVLGGPWPNELPRKTFHTLGS